MYSYLFETQIFDINLISKINYGLRFSSWLKFFDFLSACECLELRLIAQVLQPSKSSHPLVHIGGLWPHDRAALEHPCFFLKKGTAIGLWASIRM